MPATQRPGLGHHRGHKPKGYPAAFWFAVAGPLVGAFQAGCGLGIMNTCMSHVAGSLGIREHVGGAALVAALLYGATAGALLSGSVAQWLGPRRVLILNCILLQVGVLMCTIPRVDAFATGRVLVGIGSGIATTCGPRLIMEVAPKHLRGALGTQTQVVINAGILFSYLLGLPYERKDWGDWLPNLDEVAWWRVMFGICALLPVVQLLLLLASPESPVWLEWAGHSEAADAVYIALYGDVAICPERPDEETSTAGPDEEQRLLADHIRDGLRSSSSIPNQSLVAFLFRRRYRKMLMLCLGIPAFQQLSGVNSVIFYSAQVFMHVGLRSPVSSAIFVGVVNLLCTLLAGSLMDNVGRRPLLLASHGGMAALLTALAALLVYGSDGAAVRLGCFFSLVAYIACFAVGAGPVPWLYLPEILPSSVKGMGTGLGVAANWGCAILVGQLFPLMETRFGLGLSYLIFAGANLLGLVVLGSIVQETSRQSVHDIHRALLLPEGNEKGDHGKGDHGHMGFAIDDIEEDPVHSIRGELASTASSSPPDANLGAAPAIPKQRGFHSPQRHAATARQQAIARSRSAASGGVPGTTDEARALSASGVLDGRATHLAYNPAQCPPSAPAGHQPQAQPSRAVTVGDSQRVYTISAGGSPEPPGFVDRMVRRFSRRSESGAPGQAPRGAGMG